MQRHNSESRLPREIRAARYCQPWRGTLRKIRPGSRIDGDGRAMPPGTITLGYFLHGHLRGSAQIIPSGRRKRETAEVRLSVDAAWQNCGVGTMLMNGAIEHARSRSIGGLYLRCHALNVRMQRLAEKFGAEIGFEDSACFARLEVASVATCHGGG
jgi:GNAT superfamily N-acetyltransferase